MVFKLGESIMIKNLYKDLIYKRIEENIEVKKALLHYIDYIEKIAAVILNAYKNGRKVILFGNGGSAADAQHIAAELLGKYYLKRRSLSAIALTVNTSSLTAISNDYSFYKVFSLQIQAIGEEGDIAIGISTSGDSKNVIQALKIAKKKGLITIGFTGKDGGELRSIVDYCLQVPSSDTPRIQEAHITVGHIICEIIEKDLFSRKSL